MTVAGDFSGRGGGARFTLAVIPTTLEKTTLGTLPRRGSRECRDRYSGPDGRALPAAYSGSTHRHQRESPTVDACETPGIRHGMSDPSIQPRTAATHTSSPDPRPTIGISMGDPGGIGAEVIVKALADPELRKLARFVVFGLKRTYGLRRRPRRDRTLLVARPARTLLDQRFPLSPRQPRPIQTGRGRPGLRRNLDPSAWMPRGASVPAGRPPCNSSAMPSTPP